MKHDTSEKPRYMISGSSAAVPLLFAHNQSYASTGILKLDYH